MSLQCKAILTAKSLAASAGLGVLGTDIREVARIYQKIYATIAGYRYLNETVGGISRGQIPMTFSVEPATTNLPLGSLQFSNRILEPGEAFDCYTTYIFDNPNPLARFLDPWFEPC